MSLIKIRGCQKSDLTGIVDVCYLTGFDGEDLTGLGIFEDKKLFGQIFASYYPLFEPSNGFVAVDRGKVVGYILGSNNTLKQEKQFKRRMLWDILTRLLLVSAWRFPESFRAVLRFLRVPRSPKPVITEYKAHFHINLLPQYQREGIGSRLLTLFENHIRNLGISGIHFSTSTRNVKAIKFYQKKGYKIHSTNYGSLWPSLSKVYRLIFTKKLLD